MPAYRLVILPSASHRIRHLAPDLKRVVREAIRAIAQDPSKGEQLRQELRDYRKYRVRRFRVVFQVDRAAKTITIMSVGHRRTVYEDMVSVLKERQEG